MSCVTTKNMLRTILLIGVIFMDPAYSVNSDNTYALATGSIAAERLELQDRLLSKNSHEHLIRAGISNGKVVWDIGCGNGMMTEYIAKVVGESGHVYAMDVSEEQLTVAAERIKSVGLNNVTFLLGDIVSQENLPKGTADIVYARFLLMHLQHPKNAIEKMKMLLKPGGVIASQESMMSTCYSSYQTDIFKEYTNAVVTLGKFKGVDYDIGNQLKKIYESVNFSRVDEYFHQQKISLQDAQKLLLLGLNEWKNKAIEAKVATKEEIDFWEETFKNLPINDPSFSFNMAKQSYILAWQGESQN